MSEENKYMDQSFRKMSEDFQSAYHKDFWKEMNRQLEDELMDDAFKTAAEGSTVATTLPTDLDFKSLDEAFMDDAFKTAAEQQSVSYSSDLWQRFNAQRKDLEMNEAFEYAAKHTNAHYEPQYWNEATTVLEQEGLHYEYKKAYWDEARVLLDKSDRKTFFYRWTAIAGMLLMISALVFNFNNPWSNLTGIANAEKRGGFTERMRPVNNQNESEIEVQNEPVFDRQLPSNEFLTQNQASVESSDQSEAMNNTAINSMPENDKHTEDMGISPDLRLDEEKTNEFDDMTRFENLEKEETDHAFSEHLATIKTDDENKSDFNEKLVIIDAINTSEIKPIPFYAKESELAVVHPIKKLHPTRIHEVSLVGYTGFGNRYNTAGFLAEQRNSLGLNYTLSGLGKKNNLEIGFSALCDRVKINSLGLQKVSVDYDDYGDATRYWYNVSYRNSFYATGRFTLSYKIGRDHKIGVGIGATQLVAVQTNLANRSTEDEIEITNNNWGIKEGLNRYDATLNVGYEYQLSNLFSVSVNAGLGMNDRTENEFFETDFIDREKTVMIGLKYVLFRGLR